MDKPIHIPSHPHLQQDDRLFMSTQCPELAMVRGSSDEKSEVVWATGLDLAEKTKMGI